MQRTLSAKEFDTPDTLKNSLERKPANNFND